MAKTPSRPRDANQLAKLMIDIASGEVADAPPKDAAAVEMGRKGGAARAASMTPEQRSQTAKDAAARRWAKAKA